LATLEAFRFFQRLGRRIQCTHGLRPLIHTVGGKDFAALGIDAVGKRAHHAQCFGLIHSIHLLSAEECGWKMNDQTSLRADRSLKIISEEKPRDWRKRMRFAFSSRVAAGVRYLRSRISFAFCISFSEGEKREMSSSLTPFALRSWRMRAAPYLRDSRRARSSAKRSSES